MTKDESSKSSRARNVLQPTRIARHVQPLGPRVLIRIIKDSDRMESGLFLPEGSKSSHAEALLAEVIEVARVMPKTEIYTEEDDDRDNDEPRASLGENVSGVPLGAKILFEKSRGCKIPWDESLRILEVRYILAIVDEVREEEFQ